MVLFTSQHGSVIRCSYESIKVKWFLLCFKETAADSSTPVMISEYLPCAAASAAKDGEAPESSLDGSLREKQHKGGAVCVSLADDS